MSNSLISTNPLDGQEIGRVEIASKRVVEDTVEKRAKHNRLGVSTPLSKERALSKMPSVLLKVKLKS